MLRTIFGSKREEVTGRTLHNEELNDNYSSPNMVRVIKLRGIRWVGSVANMGVRRGTYGVWVGNLTERDKLEDPGVDWRIILRQVFMKWMGMNWIDLVRDADGWWVLVNAVMNIRVP